MDKLCWIIFCWDSLNLSEKMRVESDGKWEMNMNKNKNKRWVFPDFSVFG